MDLHLSHTSLTSRRREGGKHSVGDGELIGELGSELVDELDDDDVPSNGTEAAGSDIFV